LPAALPAAPPAASPAAAAYCAACPAAFRLRRARKSRAIHATGALVAGPVALTAEEEAALGPPAVMGLARLGYVADED
jgi:hypothetical protein